jgi:ubiquinone/menaquinone biosynthesis C-methylase UbiE
VTQAAFKNFSRPARALEEMHRVLRPGGTAIVQDMSKDASTAAIAEEVKGMGVGRVNAAMTRVILSRLRRRAYTPSQFAQLVAESPFGTCQLRSHGISLEVRCTKQPAR